jgi:hypothetical protein
MKNYIVFLISWLIIINQSLAQTYFHPYGTPNISNLQNKGDMQIYCGWMDVGDGDYNPISGLHLNFNYALTNRFFIGGSANYNTSSTYTAFKHYTNGSGWFQTSYNTPERTIKVNQSVTSLSFGRTDFVRIKKSRNSNFYYSSSLGLNLGSFNTKETQFNYMEINRKVLSADGTLILGFSGNIVDFFWYYKYSICKPLSTNGFVSDSLPDQQDEYRNGKYDSYKSFQLQETGIGFRIGYKWIKIQQSIGPISKRSFRINPQGWDLFNIGNFVGSTGIIVTLKNKRYKEERDE